MWKVDNCALCATLSLRRKPKPGEERQFIKQEFGSSACLVHNKVQTCIFTFWAGCRFGRAPFAWLGLDRKYLVVPFFNRALRCCPKSVFGERSRDFLRRIVARISSIHQTRHCRGCQPLDFLIGKCVRLAALAFALFQKRRSDAFIKVPLGGNQPHTKSLKYLRRLRVSCLNEF